MSDEFIPATVEEAKQIEEEYRQENCYTNRATKFAPNPCGILDDGGCCFGCDDFEDTNIKYSEYTISNPFEPF